MRNKLFILITATLLSITLIGCNSDDNPPDTPHSTLHTPHSAPAPTPDPLGHEDYEEPEPEYEPTAEELEFLNYDGPEMIMHHIWPETFRKLIETADRDLMREAEQREHYRPSEQEDMLLRFMLIHERAETMLLKDEAMAYGVPGLTINREIFETFSSVEEIENILRENGINETVTDYFLFMHELHFEMRIPPTVVAHTENDIYFISIEMEDGIPLNNVYTHSEYLEKYRMYDGTLIVNEKTIPLPAEKLTFEHKMLLAPLRVVLEAIGCELRVESETTNFEETFASGEEQLEITMFFSRNGRNYSLKIERWAPGLIDLDTGYYLLDVFPEDHLHFLHGIYSTTEDFEFYVDETVLRNILTLIDATAEVDYEARQLKITS